MTPWGIIIILVLGVLFFGKNLPDMAHKLGLALTEFRKGVDEWKETHHRSATSVGAGKVQPEVMRDEDERFEALGTKFEPTSEGV